MNFGPLDALIRAWLTLPFSWMMGLLVLSGLIAGACVNHVIATWCWFPHPVSPWVHLSSWKWTSDQQIVADRLPPRTLMDRVPVMGWWRLRRESGLHGRGFWVRPMLIEIALAAALPLMLNAYISGQMLPNTSPPPFVTACIPWMTLLFFFHAVLLILMAAATFIDLDERTIPDTITIPGTMFGLLIASLTPYVFMPGSVVTGASPVTFQHPQAIPLWWDQGSGLILAFVIWSAWCFALADRRVILRRGIGKAVEYFVARLFRHPSWKFLAVIWLTGLIAIGVVYRIGGLHWLGLLSSLSGLAVGGGLVWAIRLVGSWAMRMEAMGFGDVTLMAMIGSFLGWQASIAAFFLAPMAAILIVLIQFVITRDRSTPFGPYLCAGTILTVAFWDPIYNGNLSLTITIMGDLLLWIGLAILGLLGGMLWVWRIIKSAIFGDPMDSRRATE